MVSTGTGTITTNAAGSLPLYESDPSVCEFVPLERKGKLEKQDVWGGIKGKAGLPEANNLWFVHPAYFISHLDKAGMLKEFVTVFDNTEGYTDLVTFYNHIAKIAMDEYRAKGSDTYCNLFVKHVFKDYFPIEIYDKIFRAEDNQNMANALYDHFKDHPETFENINSLIVNDVENGLRAIQNMADRGDLILMSYKAAGHGHIAFVGHSKLIMEAAPAVAAYDKRNITEFGYEYWPVVVQAGKFTGITSMVYAANKWRETQDKIDESNIVFYKIRRW